MWNAERVYWSGFSMKLSWEKVRLPDSRKFEGRGDSSFCRWFGVQPRCHQAGVSLAVQPSVRLARRGGS